MTSARLVPQVNYDTLTLRDVELGKFGASPASSLAPGSVQTPMPAPTPDKISHRLRFHVKYLLLSLPMFSIPSMSREAGEIF